MKTRRCIISLIALMLSGVCYAQKVITETVDGTAYVVVDCSSMKPSTYTTIKKGQTQNELKTVAANAKAYKKFAIAHNDVGSADGEAWSTAFIACQNKGKGWRLPVLRELILMNVLCREIAVVGKTNKVFKPMIASYYWSATEIMGDFAFGALFPSGLTKYGKKDSTNNIRCIKEL